MMGSKRPAEITGDVLPMEKRPKVSRDKTPAIQKPVLPEATEQRCARDIAKQLIPYVQAQLPSVLVNIKISPWVPIPDLAAQDPLPIPFVAAQCGVGASSSYKEAWVPAHCYVSCRDSGLYEVGGNLCWVDAEVGGQTTVHCIFPSWQSVVTTAETCFNPVQPDAT